MHLLFELNLFFKDFHVFLNDYFLCLVRGLIVLAGPTSISFREEV